MFKLLPVVPANPATIHRLGAQRLHAVVPAKSRISRAARLVVLEIEMPRKKAGVGKARTEPGASVTGASANRFRG
jgi:hypothetical protein